MLTKTIGFALGIILFPITILFHIYGYRHVLIFTDRIGHLALEPDCLLKAQYLGQLNQKKWILLAPINRTANEHLLTYWKHHFIVIRNRTACFLIRNMSRFFFMRYNVKHFIRNIGKPQAAFNIYTAWGDRPPIVSLTKGDEVWGREMLALLGLPNDAWFVCVHARESGFSPVDEELQHHRNCKIENTFDAIEEIVRRGGWVIRIGDPTMKKLPIMHNVIDYAHHPLKSPRLDIILCALARFILGNTSGISLVGSIFGTPCALSNMTPISALGVSPKDISIPKLFWSHDENRYLRFDEAISSEIVNSQFADNYLRLGIKLEENSENDILNLSIEMLDQLNGRSNNDDNCIILQMSFMKLIERHHYSYNTSSLISYRFLSKHSDLI